MLDFLFLDFLFGNKGEDLRALFVCSLKLLGEGTVRTPSYRRLWLAIFNRIFVLTILCLMTYNSRFHLGAVALVIMFPFGLFVLFPFSFFYNVKMKACQTWMAYKALTSGSATIAEGELAARDVKWSLRLFALAELLFATKSSEDKRAGLVQALSQMLLSALEAVFDVVEAYLLPAMVIEQKSISQVVPHLRDLKKNVPATLAGAFGFDFFGNAISALIWFLHLGIFAFGLLIGLGSGYMVPVWAATTVPPALSPGILGSHAHIFLVPVYVCILFSTLLNRSIKIFVSSLKDTYFTVFYTSINHPLDIRADMRDRVTHYLNFQDASYSQSLRTMFAQKFPVLAAKPTPAPVPDAVAAANIETVVQGDAESSHTPEQMREFLKAKGYSEEKIASVLDVMSKYRNKPH